jgi:hypothetical protein
MAAYTDIDATVGGSTSNSYVTGVEADTFASFQSWDSTWTGKTESERTIALLNAAKWLDTVPFAGTRCNPSSDDKDKPQAMSWPRSDVSCDGLAATCTMIPKEIKETQILIAFNLVVNPELITGTPGGGGGAQAGTFIKRNKLGDLEQEFAEFTSNSSAGPGECVDCSTPAIIAALPWLKGVLSCWADISVPGVSKVILRVRS